MHFELLTWIDIRPLIVFSPIITAAIWAMFVWEARIMDDFWW
jgi:hypothetical protein